MGFFDNVISDSRLHLRDAGSTMFPATGVTGNLLSPWMVEDTLLSETGEQPVGRAVEVPAQQSEAALSSTGVSPIAGYPPVGITRTAAGTSAVPVELPVEQPESSSGRVNSLNVANDQAPTTDGGSEQRQEPSPVAPERRAVTVNQRVSAASISGKVQRQVIRPGVSSATPSSSDNPFGTDNPSGQEVSPPVVRTSEPPNSTHFGPMTMSDTAPSMPGTRSLTTQAAGVRGLPTSTDWAAHVEVSVNEPAVDAVQVRPVQGRLQNELGSYVSASYGPASIARPSSPTNTRPAASGSPTSVPQPPQVRIGQVNVIVESPSPPRTQSPSTITEDLSSRLLLRSL